MDGKLREQHSTRDMIAYQQSNCGVSGRLRRIERIQVAHMYIPVNLYSYLPGAVATYFLGLLHRCALRNLNAAGLGAVLQIPPL